VWLVDCDEAQQLTRLMHRDGLNEAEARARLAAQWPLARKRALADRVILNRGTPQQLQQAIEALPWESHGASNSATTDTEEASE